MFTGRERDTHREMWHCRLHCCTWCLRTSSPDLGLLASPPYKMRLFSIGWEKAPGVGRIPFLPKIPHACSRSVTKRMPLGKSFTMQCHPLEQQNPYKANFQVWNNNVQRSARWWSLRTFLKHKQSGQCRTTNRGRQWWQFLSSNKP